MEPRAILAELSPEKFEEIVRSSPKSFREQLFRGYGIRVKSSLTRLRSDQKNALRIKALHEIIRQGVDLGGMEEMLRNWFYSKRSLLGAALDFFQVSHEDGLTDSDLDFMEKLEPEKTAALVAHLTADHPVEDVAIYMKYMKIPGVDEALDGRQEKAGQTAVSGE